MLTPSGRNPAVSTVVPEICMIEMGLETASKRARPGRPGPFETPFFQLALLAAEKPST